jgi:hypothetical protein
VALVHNNLEAFNSTVRIRGEGSTLMVDGGVVVQDSNLTIENQGLVSLLFGDLVVGSSSTVVLRGGVLDMGNGRVNLQSPSSQFLFAEGTLKNVIRFDGNLAQSGGVLEISQSGPLSIDGAFTMTSDATLRVDLADFSAFGSSFLQVQNQVVLAGGTLKILLGEGEGPFYEPRLGDAFSIFGGSYSMLIGEFDELILPELDEGLVWDLSYDSEVFGNPQVILEVVAGFSGDFTGDGSVDAADLGEWESRFGDDLDGRDFLNWQRQYGSGDQPLAIPEPSTAVLILSALLPLLAATPAGVRAPLPGLRLRGNTFCDCVVSRPSES